MSKIPVSNPTAMPIWVAGQMIPPGETRHFDAHHVPAEHRAAPAAPPPAEAPPPDPLEIIRAGSVKDIAAGLATLADDELQRLDALEQGSDKPRKGVLEAIAAERLRRAAGNGEQ